MSEEDLSRRRGGDRRQAVDRRYDGRDDKNFKERRRGLERRIKFSQLLKKNFGLTK